MRRDGAGSVVLAGFVAWGLGGGSRESGNYLHALRWRVAIPQIPMESGGGGPVMSSLGHLHGCTRGRGGVMESSPTASILRRERSGEVLIKLSQLALYGGARGIWQVDAPLLPFC
ncbi:hypothetical protein VPH35_073034 [Triticum aestivum]